MSTGSIKGLLQMIETLSSGQTGEKILVVQNETVHDTLQQPLFAAFSYFI